MTSVSCRSGFRYPDRPKAFTWMQSQEEVRQVEREWRTPNGLHFIVCTVSGRRFDLQYEVAVDSWSATLLGVAGVGGLAPRDELPQRGDAPYVSGYADCIWQDQRHLPLDGPEMLRGDVVDSA
jgi:hypothetical protein